MPWHQKVAQVMVMLTLVLSPVWAVLVVDTVLGGN